MYTRVKVIHRLVPGDRNGLTDYESRTVFTLFRLYPHAGWISFLHKTDGGSHRLKIDACEIGVIVDSVTHRIVPNGIILGKEVEP